METKSAAIKGRLEIKSQQKSTDKMITHDNG